MAKKRASGNPHSKKNTPPSGGIKNPRQKRPKTKLPKPEIPRVKLPLT